MAEINPAGEIEIGRGTVMIGFGEVRVPRFGARFRPSSKRALARAGAEPVNLEVPPFSVVHAEGLSGLCQATSFGLTPPFSMPGKAWIGDRLQPTGVEVSFLKVLPWDAAPFEQRHRKNEVVYVVAAGCGQFLVDRQSVEVKPGTVLRISPNALRAWRNVSSEELLLIVIQGRAGTLRPKGRSDAIGQPGLIPWWRYPRARGERACPSAKPAQGPEPRPGLFRRLSKLGRG